MIREKKMQNRKKGFTVVELVIVIAVIAILSAVLIPTFVGLSNRAKETALQENLRNAYVAYTADADPSELLAQDEVYLVVDGTATVEAGVKAYSFNKTDAVWSENELPALGTGESYKAVVDENQDPINYNGYNIYYIYVE